MTYEELREELWNLQSDMARMREHEHKMRMQFFRHIRHLAGQHKDEQRNVLWDVIEAELRKSDGLISPPTGVIRWDEGITMNS
jgi:hypothetical protein